MRHLLREKRAFTLIELMVSVALFTIVMSIVATAYLHMLSLDRRVRATNDVSNNLNFVVDTMARSIRTGTTYQCGGGTNCVYPSGQSTFTFKDDQSNTVKYALSAGQITECSGSGCIDTPITDPRITISNLTFFVSGVGAGDTVQPFVTFIIKGSITVDPQQTPVAFSIQTSAIMRQTDI
jgi:prepilin-type N-terminal cleavage/methylation domain-containing protein